VKGGYLRNPDFLMDPFTEKLYRYVVEFGEEGEAPKVVIYTDVKDGLSIWDSPSYSYVVTAGNPLKEDRPWVHLNPADPWYTGSPRDEEGARERIWEHRGKIIEREREHALEEPEALAEAANTLFDAIRSQDYESGSHRAWTSMA